MTMIDIKPTVVGKSAVNVAISYFNDILGSTDYKSDNLLVEEVERKDYLDNKDCWFITLGFDEIKEVSNIQAIAGLKSIRKRKYKTIIIDQKGTVLAYKIKEVEFA